MGSEKRKGGDTPRLVPPRKFSVVTDRNGNPANPSDCVWVDFAWTDYEGRKLEGRNCEAHGHGYITKIDGLDPEDYERARNIR